MLRSLFPSRALALFRGPRGLTLAALLVSCRSPTEVELVLSTDVPCASFKGAAIFVSSSQDGAESSAPSTVAYGCDDSGELGSLVVIPAGDKDQPLFVRIVAGVDLDATRCTESDPDNHCIVTRRRLSFLPHEHLTLPVSLDVDCRGLLCGQTQACQKGRCIDATIDPNACTDGPSPCELPSLDGQGGQGGGGGQSGSSGSGGLAGLSGSSGDGGQGGVAGLAGQGGLSGTSGQSSEGGQAGTAGQSGGTGQGGAGQGGAGQGGAGQGGAGQGGASQGGASQGGASQGGAGQAGGAGKGGSSVVAAGQGGSSGGSGQGGIGGLHGLGGSVVSSLGGSNLCGADASPCGLFTLCDASCCGDDYTCNNGAGYNRYTCVGTSWTLTHTCASSCDDIGECQSNTCGADGATRCPPDATTKTVMQVCQGGHWTNANCQADFECDTNTQRCACDPVPKGGAISNDGLQMCTTQTVDGKPAKYFQSCESGKWSKAVKCVASSCDPSQALGGTCQLGQL